MHDTFGLAEAMSVRLSLLSAALWWAGFTIIPLVRLRNYAPVNVVAEQGTIFQRSFGQLFTTLRELRNYPMTLTFLLAYLFYNDGIQTVIYAASTYGSKQLKFDQGVLIATILLIQFVAFGGALYFGRLAARYGAYRSILWGTYAWMVIVVLALFLPEKNVALFLALAIAIGVVLGGTQALSRSFFSLLIPRGREGEYFSLYGAAERGHLLVRDPAVRRRLPGHRLLPAGDLRADHLLRARRVLPAAPRPRARHPRGGQPGPGEGLDAPGRDPCHSGVRRRLRVGNPWPVRLVEPVTAPRRGASTNPPDRRHDRLAEPSQGRYA